MGRSSMRLRVSCAGNMTPNGSSSLSLSSCTLIAISCRLTGERSRGLAGSSIVVLADALQPGVVGEEPEKGVGGEQKLHSMYSRNSSTGSSKSSDIQILPWRLPALG